MHAGQGSPGPGDTVAGAARRRQIVTAAIAVLAREGHRAATLSRIATEADLSSAGLITYHFTDRRQLLAAVVGSVVGGYEAEVREAVSTASDATSALDAYIAAAVAFQDRHRDGVRALWQVIWSTSESGDGRAIDKDAQLAPLLKILARGQASGEFRGDIGDATWVARSISSTVTSYMDVFSDDPDVDVDAFTGEVQRLFRRALVRERR